MGEKALTAVNQEAYIHDVSTSSIGVLIKAFYYNTMTNGQFKEPAT